ncbi:hypothetical protein D3C76_1485800 [compost metagenome]
MRFYMRSTIHQAPSLMTERFTVCLWNNRLNRRTLSRRCLVMKRSRIVSWTSGPIGWQDCCNGQALARKLELHCYASGHLTYSLALSVS